nr:hypothetical protein Itr_chr05CG22940 [Ipomoea trifida]
MALSCKELKHHYLSLSIIDTKDCVTPVIHQHFGIFSLFYTAKRDGLIPKKKSVATIGADEDAHTVKSSRLKGRECPRFKISGGGPTMTTQRWHVSEG